MDEHGIGRSELSSNPEPSPRPSDTAIKNPPKKPYVNYISGIPIELPDGTYSVRTPRTFDDYCQQFNYDPNGEGLKGRMVLDVGTGDSDFAHESRERNLARVISLDADYGKNPPPDTKNIVACFSQKLPFKDGRFDEVISSYLFQWLAEDDISKTLSEMVRVTKDNGMVKIYPARAANPNINLPTHIALVQHVQNGDLTLEIKKDTEVSESAWDNAFEQVRQNVKFYMG